MLPINEIHVGDNFQVDPSFWDSVVFRVEDINKEEKMIKIHGWSPRDGHLVGKPFWKKNTDRIFCESKRYGGI